MEDVTTPSLREDLFAYWCERHLHSCPLPGRATVMLVNAALADVRLRQSIDTKDPEHIEAALKQAAPLCCFMGDEWMVALNRDMTRTRSQLATDIADGLVHRVSMPRLKTLTGVWREMTPGLKRRTTVVGVCGVSLAVVGLLDLIGSSIV